MNPSLKYSGEALCLALIGFRLLRWAWGAVSEGDAPPSADAANPLTIGAALMGNGEEPMTTHGVAPTGDPTLFPPNVGRNDPRATYPCVGGARQAAWGPDGKLTPRTGGFARRTASP